MAQATVDKNRIFSMFNVDGQFKRPMQVFSFDTMFQPMPGFGKTPGEENKALKYCVKSIKLPELKIESIDDMHFGGFKLTLPTYNIAERTLKIDFEEDDKMSVTNAFLPYLKPATISPRNLLVSNGEWKITIAIYNEYTPEKEPEIKEYAASLLSMSTPNLNRNGSVGACGISTEWYVKPFDPNSVDFIPEEPAEVKPPKQPVPKIVHDRDTKNFIVGEEEVDAIYDVLYAKTGKKVNRQELKQVLEENAKAMDKAYKTFKSELNKMGIVVDINAYNDTGHAAGLGTTSGSHLLGQKIDLNFKSGGKKLTANSMTATQRDAIATAAQKAGLVTNYESSNVNSSSFWGDFALASAASLDKNGRLIKKQNMKSWVGKNQVYDTRTNSRSGVGK